MEQLAIFIIIAVVFGGINAVVEKAQAARRAVQVAAERERQRRLRESMGGEAPDYTKPFVGTTLEAKLEAPGSARGGARRSGGVVVRDAADEAGGAATPGAAEALSPADRWRQLLEGTIAAGERAASEGVDPRGPARATPAASEAWKAEFRDARDADSPWGAPAADSSAGYGSDLSDGAEEGYDFGGEDRLAGSGGGGRDWSGGWSEESPHEADVWARTPSPSAPAAPVRPAVGIAMGDAIGEGGDAIGDRGHAIGEGGRAIGEAEDELGEPLHGSAAATVSRRRRPGGRGADGRLRRALATDRGDSLLRTLVVSDVVLRPRWRE